MPTVCDAVMFEGPQPVIMRIRQHNELQREPEGSLGPNLKQQHPMVCSPGLPGSLPGPNATGAGIPNLLLLKRLFVYSSLRQHGTIILSTYAIKVWTTALTAVMVLCGMYASSRYSFFLYETQDLKNVDIGSFMDNFLRLVRDDFEKKGIALETALDPGMTAKAELRALQQVLLNILPMQQMEKMKEIFKPFFTTKSRGTGLGLVIVKKMLARMNGMIDIKSGVDAGIVVDIVIPGGTDERS